MTKIIKIYNRNSATPIVKGQTIGPVPEEQRAQSTQHQEVFNVAMPPPPHADRSTAGSTRCKRVVIVVLVIGLALGLGIGLGTRRDGSCSCSDVPQTERPIILASLEDASQDVQDLVKSKEDVILMMANKAEEAFKLRQSLTRDCSCIPNRCSNVLGEDATCGLILGSAEECGAQEGTMYSMDRGMIDLPQETLFPDNLPGGVKATICLMNHLDTEAVPLLQQKNVTSWAYVGTEQGVIYSYPGRLGERSLETGLEQWNFCEPYDPRIRPWYHEGAAGPLDIVLVIDVSGSMNDRVDGSLTRWDIVQSALIKFVDTLTFTDFFNIVFFNSQGRSMVCGLLVGNAENRQKAKNFITSFSPSGSTSFLAAFETAFDALSIAAEGTCTSGCNKVIIFLTDGKDSSGTEAILNQVEQFQTNLESISRQRANIFSFSIGENADDSIPRQLACMHNGAWAPIASQDDPLTVFNIFLKFIASARNTTQIFWSEVYEDAWGTGELISAAMPVYTPQLGANIPGTLFGVVGHDVRVSDFRQLVGDQQAEQVFKLLQEDSKLCDESQNNPCLQQVLRGEDVECADLSYQSANCVKFDSKYYKKSQTTSTWSDAKSSCQESGGQLAVLNSAAEQAILAGVAAFEGSWIGLSNNGYQWEWEDAQNITNPENIWAYGEPSYQTSCGTIAPSGTTKNVYSQPCSSTFTHICEFENLPSECGDDFINLDDPNYQFLMPRIQQCSSAESLELISYFDTVALPDILPQDLFCLDNFSSPQMPTDFYQDLFCCQES